MKKIVILFMCIFIFNTANAAGYNAADIEKQVNISLRSCSGENPVTEYDYSKLSDEEKLNNALLYYFKLMDISLSVDYEGTPQCAAYFSSFQNYLMESIESIKDKNIKNSKKYYYANIIYHLSKNGLYEYDKIMELIKQLGNISLKEINSFYKEKLDEKNSKLLENSYNVINFLKNNTDIKGDLQAALFYEKIIENKLTGQLLFEAGKFDIFNSFTDIFSAIDVQGSGRYVSLLTYLKDIDNNILTKFVKTFSKTNAAYKVNADSTYIDMLEYSVVKSVDGQDKFYIFPFKERVYVIKTTPLSPKLYDMFFRISAKTVGMLLEKALGRANRTFNINKMTDLEGEILTAFNDYMFRIMAKFLTPTPVVNIKRTNFDMIHLTFIVKNKDDGEAGKFIISIPSVRLEANKVVSKEDKFEYSDFYQCPIKAKIQIGSTRFTVKEMKELAKEDIILLENSRLDMMKFILKDYEKDFNINPNMGLEHPLDGDGGYKMDENTENTNLWDSIEVDMYAEFDPVKITLGNLKKIEEGLVVDIAALYDNKVTLRVENKVIGHGELVIINDRYGVKISDIVEKGQMEVEDMQSAAPQPNPVQQAQPQMQQAPQQDAPPEPMPAPEPQPGEEEEFDYSDFELEDEDI